MDLAPLEVDADEARARLEEYRTAIRKERNVEDEAIAAAYRAAAKGLPIISLEAAVTAGGFFDNGLPRIAVCRANATSCTVERWWSGRGLTFSDEHARRWGTTALVGSHTVKVRVDMPRWDRVRASTVVPPVPPRHRPERTRLASLHILWEVENWDPTPPRDPALLRHIRGDLWAVIATWDLTDIERHVLAQRISPT